MMKLLLASLSMLFGASIILVILLHLAPDRFAEAYPNQPRVPFPSNVWFSTLVLIASSVTMQFAVSAARAGRRAALRSAMCLTLILAAAFLTSQTLSWFVLVAQYAEAIQLRHTPQAVTIYFMLTGLHAAHVIGGIIPMLVVTIRAFLNRYTRASHEGVVLCAMYWHYLDVVWLILASMLLILR